MLFIISSLYSLHKRKNVRRLTASYSFSQTSYFSFIRDHVSLKRLHFGRHSFILFNQRLSLPHNLYSKHLLFVTYIFVSGDVSLIIICSNNVPTIQTIQTFSNRLSNQKPLLTNSIASRVFTIFIVNVTIRYKTLRITTDNVY